MDKTHQEEWLEKNAVKCDLHNARIAPFACEQYRNGDNGELCAGCTQAQSMDKLAKKSSKPAGRKWATSLRTYARRGAAASMKTRRGQGDA